MKPTLLTTLAAAFLATVLLISPVSADSITTNSPQVYEGQRLTFTVKMSRPLFRTCYDYHTENDSMEDGIAAGVGWFRDFIPTQGTLCWEPFRGGQRTVTVETVSGNHQLCEEDETVRVILSNYRYYTRAGWLRFCGSGHRHPCQVTATGTIRPNC